jgi:hypothetical protein
VRTAAVAVRVTDAGRQLVAFVTPAPDTHPDPASLLGQLRATLPAYLVPARLLVVDRLPLTATGKLDRAALAALAVPLPERPTERVAPATRLERLVAGVWQDVLGVPDIGRYDDFFALGGQSLLAVRAMARLSKDTGLRLSLGLLLECRTVDAVARFLQDAGAGEPRG